MSGILHPILKKTQPVMMRKRKNDLWTITGEFIYRHHIVPRVKLYVAERRNISYSDEVHRRYQNDSYLDVMMEKHIEDYWNADGDREL